MTGDLSPSCEQEKSCNLSENKRAVVAATKESCSKSVSVHLLNINLDY